jgi:hypothetical protein
MALIPHTPGLSALKSDQKSWLLLTFGCAPLNAAVVALGFGSG